MKIALLLIAIAGVLYFYFSNTTQTKVNIPGKVTTDSKDAPQTEIIAQNLEIPWALAFLPDGNILVTERPGNVLLVNNNKSEILAQIPDAREIGEGGLLGIALHPDFENNHYIYLYYTYGSSEGRTLNRVVRMTYEDSNLTSEKVIVNEIPGASNHNGGRIKFGPDKFLYITTGDAQNPSLSQTRDSLAGKILRVTDEGNPAPGNPFNTRIYSWGHRNPQGLAWNEKNELFAPEHGSSTLDEVNKIERGANYGWPEIRGDDTKQGMEKPLIHSGSDTWAPGGAAVFGNKLYFGGLRGSALFELDINSLELKTHFKNEFGRIRDVILGPDNMLYITTSNRDGRGFTKTGDDKIIRVNPTKL